MNQRDRASVNPEPAPATAEVAGHFGELLQGRLGPDGPVVLVTLPCPAFVTCVSFEPSPGPIEADDPVSDKARAAARQVLLRLGRAGQGGRLGIVRPVAPGLGAGSSTAETLGAVRAVAACHGVRLGADVEAELCLMAEGAIDPLMHAGPVLFASRAGRVLRRLPGLPALAVAGGFAGPPRPTDAGDARFAEIEWAAERLAHACGAGDAAAVGVVSEASAAANQALRPNPAWQAVGRIGSETGALGRVVSHTGAAIGLIYREVPAGVTDRLSGAGLRDVLTWKLGYAE